MIKWFREMNNYLFTPNTASYRLCDLWLWTAFLLNSLRRFGTLTFISLFMANSVSSGHTYLGIKMREVVLSLWPEPRLLLKKQYLESCLGIPSLFHKFHGAPACHFPLSLVMTTGYCYNFGGLSHHLHRCVGVKVHINEALAGWSQSCSCPQDAHSLQTLLVSRAMITNALGRWPGAAFLEA